MSGVEAQIGIGMKDARLEKPVLRESHESWPGDPMLHASNWVNKIAKK
jgi:hypothetical protein